jgi:hypothetical protein
MQHGVCGEMQQIASINEWYERYAGRQNVVIQLLYFLVDSLEDRLRVRTFL